MGGGKPIKRCPGNIQRINGRHIVERVATIGTEHQRAVESATMFNHVIQVSHLLLTEHDNFFQALEFSLFQEASIADSHGLVYTEFGQRDMLLGIVIAE